MNSLDDTKTKTQSVDVDPNARGDYRRLIFALLLRGVRDAVRGDTEAATWLSSDDAATWARLVDCGEYWPPDLDSIPRGLLAGNCIGNAEASPFLDF